MRYSISKAIGIGILSILFLGSNGNPVTSDLACGDSCNKPSWTLAKGIHSPPPHILPRAGGGVRPGKPNDRGPDGAPHDRPNDPNNPSVPTNQNGEEGGFQGQPETGGGFNNICTRKTRWPIQWRRSGCGPGSSNPASTSKEGPPSVKNNYLQPSTEGERVATDRPMNVPARKEFFETSIKNLKNREKGPWLFYSGMRIEDAESHKPYMEMKIGHEMGYIGDLLKQRLPPFNEEYDRFTAANAQWYFWAANSKAFAQAIEGKVHAILPLDTPINQPYGDKGSNWWSFELPELTRNDKVDSISVYFVDDMHTDFIEALGEAKVIWQRGDAPLGYPGDERRHYARPTEPWNG
jgi:hypothetical protein